MIWWAAIAVAATISGHVTGPDGAGVAGATVVAYDPRLGYGYDATDDTGAYRISGLDPIWYRIRVLPPEDENFTEAWAPQSLSYCDGDIVDLTSTNAVIDVKLGLGGTLAGTLVDVDGAPVLGAYVQAADVDSSSTVAARSDTTDAAGHFVLQGLPAPEGDHGAFTLQVKGADLPTQFIPGAYDAASADVTIVSPGQTVDLGTTTMLPGITVGGAVYGGELPLTGGDVHVYSTSQVVDTPIVDGRYQARGLPPGDVLSWATVPGYALTYYPDADRPGVRVNVPNEGDENESVDLTLQAEGVLSGQILGGTNLSNVNLLAYDDTQVVGVGSTCTDDGRFEIHQIPAGNWTLYIYAAYAGLVSDYVRDDAGNPMVYAIAAGEQTSTGPVILPLGAQVSGVVSDAVTGGPVYGATIYAKSSTGRVIAASTAIDGTYTLVGLDADHWSLHAVYDAYCRNDQSWVEVWYPDLRSATFSAQVVVAAGDAVTWDVQMPEDNDQDGMDDAWEAANGLNPHADDSALDPDGDGYTNLEEYQLGTDPTNDTPQTPGCGCRGGGASSLLLALPWWVRRRRKKSGAATR